jgi:hypothetical protein
MAKNLYEAVIDYLNFMDHYEENIKAETERFVATMPEVPDISDKITTILNEGSIY